MKRNISAFALFAGTLIALATHASAQEQPFQANVPFNFTVGNRQLPLGFYRIRTLSTRQVQIENMQHNISASTLTNSAIRSRDDDKKLVFDKIGGQYFLRGIVSASSAFELPKSESEKQAQMLLKQAIDAENKTYSAQ